MKIEMFEKIGEIVVAEVRTAEENKAVAENEKARREEEARIRKEQEELRNMKTAASLITIVIENINSAANEGNNYVSFNWTEKATISKGVSFKDWKASSQYIIPILKGLGYTVSEYWYSDSWRKKSRKIGSLSIWW